jgi:hypothetical protein
MEPAAHSSDYSREIVRSPTNEVRCNGLANLLSRSVVDAKTTEYVRLTSAQKSARRICSVSRSHRTLRSNPRFNSGRGFGRCHRSPTISWLMNSGQLIALPDAPDRRQARPAPPMQPHVGRVPRSGAIWATWVAVGSEATMAEATRFGIWTLPSLSLPTAVLQDLGL